MAKKACSREKKQGAVPVSIWEPQGNENKGKRRLFADKELEKQTNMENMEYRRC